MSHSDDSVSSRHKSLAVLDGIDGRDFSSLCSPRSSTDFRRRTSAATTIQKVYRGYRARRQLNGIGLDASTRWNEAIKEATYRQRIRPMSRDHQPSNAQKIARENWRLAVEVARRAGEDDNSSDTSGDEGMTAEELEEYRKAKAEAKAEIARSAKMMDLQYWLEMVDLKHRYGSNLRAYHNEWKKSDTHENFFYWLDEGGGKHLELPTVSRQRLDSECVRYLSREERQQYLVRIDSEGRLCWAKNEERISTTSDYRDSIDGVVPNSSRTPTWSSDMSTWPPPRPRTAGSTTTASTKSSNFSDSIEDEGQHYANNDFKKAKGLKKLRQVSPATIFTQLLRKTIRPGTWIFVADTSFHLYVGIKQSGTFQHSSFLHGSRISAAGLIKIKDGRLQKLSPLSGHYRPPTKNFRLFVHSLRDAGVDMSHVSISRSYAVLVGLEAYVRTRTKIKNGIAKVTHGKDKVLNPEIAHQREEGKMDKSLSAQREREEIQEEERKLEERKANMGLTQLALEKVHIQSLENEPSTAPGPKSVPHEDIESGIPPDGKR